ncbi:hypothetical protein MTY_0551 [Moorella thermoacetica Y72]|uniref:Uncharacterized protein n=1 Tax=Moorella thermoacetica Y72 TaxID=1325331 RepID=A0A0S6U934_NEOTH|nr:hypothetical protein MTY_0551 [Moorella thermoacetica Y72]
MIFIDPYYLNAFDRFQIIQSTILSLFMLSCTKNTGNYTDFPFSTSKFLNNLPGKFTGSIGILTYKS